MVRNGGTMKYKTTLIVVEDIEKSKRFYHDILELDVENDFGANVVLTGGLALQTVKTWEDFIHMKENQIKFGNNASELYFEEDNMDKFIEKLNHIENIEYVHPLKEHSWGQRVVRFYDLDKHIIEVGENMSTVVKRFLDRGLSIEQTAVRMDVSVDYVNLCLKQIED